MSFGMQLVAGLAMPARNRACSFLGGAECVGVSVAQRRRVLTSGVPHRLVYDEGSARAATIPRRSALAR